MKTNPEISAIELGRMRVKVFARLLREKQPLPIIGAEIGVYKGNFSIPLALELGIDLSIMYGIDPYVVFYNDKGRKVFKPTWEQEHWDHAYLKMVHRSLNCRNYILVRMGSEDASHVIPDCLDFVYVDGRHEYYDVIEDISLWEEKVRKGGIIGGNDYGGKKYKTVTKAVDDYAKMHGREVMNPLYGEWYWIVK